VQGNFEVKIFAPPGGPGGSLVQYLYQNMAWDWNGNSSTVGFQTSATDGTAVPGLNGNNNNTAGGPLANNSVCSIAAPVICYANCDNSTTAPVLNVSDFSCFLTKYAAGDTYAFRVLSTLAQSLEDPAAHPTSSELKEADQKILEKQPGVERVLRERARLGQDAQVVSERLGIPFDNVSIVHGDTDKVQFGMGTYGSRSGAVGISAIVKALDKIEAKAKKVAAHMLEAAEGDIVFHDGKFTVAGTDKSAAWGEVALNAYIAHKFAGQELEPGLKEGAFYDPTNFTFPAGCHICEVEVDPQTGESEIVAWTAVDDFGTVINPMIVEGQVHGGIAQGVGQALLEGAVYDKDGQLVTGSLMDYCMPRAHDLPALKVEMTRTPSPSNPLGIKGCGEAGAIAAPVAVINAITDAIGTEDLAMPATAQAVWQALQKAQDRRKAA